MENQGSIEETTGDTPIMDSTALTSLAHTTTTTNNNIDHSWMQYYLFCPPTWEDHDKMSDIQFYSSWFLQRKVQKKRKKKKKKGKEGENEFRCELCNKTFKYKKNLKKHMGKHRRREAERKRKDEIFFRNNTGHSGDGEIYEITSRKDRRDSNPTPVRLKPSLRMILEGACNSSSSADFSLSSQQNVTSNSGNGTESPVPGGEDTDISQQHTKECTSSTTHLTLSSATPTNSSTASATESSDICSRNEKRRLVSSLCNKYAIEAFHIYDQHDIHLSPKKTSFRHTGSGLRDSPSSSSTITSSIGKTSQFLQSDGYSNVLKNSDSVTLNQGVPRKTLQFVKPGDSTVPKNTLKRAQLGFDDKGPAKKDIRINTAGEDTLLKSKEISKSGVCDVPDLRTLMPPSALNNDAIGPLPKDMNNNLEIVNGNEEAAVYPTKEVFGAVMSDPKKANELHAGSMISANMNNEPKGVDIVFGTAVHQCKERNRIFMSKWDLKKHIKAHRSKKRDKSRDDTSNEPDVTSTNQAAMNKDPCPTEKTDAVHKCVECGRVCKTRWHLEKHVAGHGTKHICNVCQRQFPSKARLLQHLMMHVRNDVTK